MLGSFSQRLGDDFQRRNLVAFKFKEEPKVNGAAGKISNQMAGDDCTSVLLCARQWLAGVLILCRDVRLPLLDCGPALMGVALVLHDGIFSEALRNGIAITFVGGEVGGDGVWQVERSSCLFHFSVLSRLCVCFSGIQLASSRIALKRSCQNLFAIQSLPYQLLHKSCIHSLKAAQQLFLIV